MLNGPHRNEKHPIGSEDDFHFESYEARIVKYVLVTLLKYCHPRVSINQLFALYKLGIVVIKPIKVYSVSRNFQIMRKIGVVQT